MITKALEEAIERAALKLFLIDGEGIHDEDDARRYWATKMDSAHLEFYRAKAKAVLSAAHPSLFDGSAWIAPWEATEEFMEDWYTGAEAARDAELARKAASNAEREALGKEPLYRFPYGIAPMQWFPHGWAAARDAYLNAEQKD